MSPTERLNTIVGKLPDPDLEVTQWTLCAFASMSIYDKRPRSTQAIAAAVRMMQDAVESCEQDEVERHACGRSMQISSNLNPQPPIGAGLSTDSCDQHLCHCQASQRSVQR